MIEPTVELLPTYDADHSLEADDPMSSLPPKERAWALYCQGHRSPEIGRLLHVSERTVRYWLAGALQDLEAERQELRAYHRDLAIDRQRQIAAAAWQCYERALTIVEDETSKSLMIDSPSNNRAASLALATAARHLAIAAAANRELARLHDALARQDADTYPHEHNPTPVPPDHPLDAPPESPHPTPQNEIAAITATSPANSPSYHPAATSWGRSSGSPSHFSGGALGERSDAFPYQRQDQRQGLEGEATTANRGNNGNTTLWLPVHSRGKGWEERSARPIILSHIM